VRPPAIKADEESDMLAAAPSLRTWLRVLVLIASLAGTATGASAGEPRGRLVDPAWLQAHRDEVLLLDASVTPQHRAAHIPGAVSVDIYRYGPDVPTPAAMEQRLQSWGVSPGRTVVVYDKGGDSMATRVFYDLYYHGVPERELYVLDGGLARWRAEGGPVTTEATPAPAPGSFHVTQVREDARSRLPEFMAASDARSGQAVVDALDADYHFGAKKFFWRGGHVPNALLMPSDGFFNADKTFKNADEIQRMARYLGIREDEVVHSHCGGGIAASVPWFALRFVASHERAKLYVESQLEWLRDDRGLPFWTYDAPQLQRDTAWLTGWNAPMLRAYGVAKLNLVDVRPAAQYAAGHVPFALNIESGVFRTHLNQPEALAAVLGPAGVNPAHEVLLVSDNALTPQAALAFLALEQAGHGRVSVLMDSVDEWALRGGELAKEPTKVGAPASPKDITVPPARYVAHPRDGVLVKDPRTAHGEYPTVFVAAGRHAPSRKPEGQVVSLPYAELIDNAGRPRPASELWTRFEKAGVPRLAQLVVFADDPAEAAVDYYVFRLMGWPDVKVWVY
jgi:thiosulfate/3-mercaptopyruvate sulfurtransferase